MKVLVKNVRRAIRSSCFKLAMIESYAYPWRGRSISLFFFFFLFFFFEDVQRLIFEVKICLLEIHRDRTSWNYHRVDRYTITMIAIAHGFRLQSRDHKLSKLWRLWRAPTGRRPKSYFTKLGPGLIYARDTFQSGGENLTSFWELRPCVF